MKSQYSLIASFFILFLCLNQHILSMEHPSGWLGDQYLILQKEETEVQDGAYALMIKMNTISPSYQRIYGQEIPVTAGHSYTLSFYYNTSAHIRVRGVLEWTGTSPTYITTWGGDGIDDTDYEFYTYSGTVPVGATGVIVRIEFNLQTGVAYGETQYLDNIKYEEPSGTIQDVYNSSFELWQDINWTEIVQQTASDGVLNNNYGNNVKIYGDYAVVGVPSRQAVYILQKDQGGTENWGELKKITGSDTYAGDEFGYSISLASQFLIVGAPAHGYDSEGANYLLSAGAVYVFRKDEGGTNNWGQYKKIVPDDRVEGDRFGASVSIYGQEFVAGSPYRDLDKDGLNYVGMAGAAYSFEYPFGYVKKKFYPEDRNANDNFGHSVSIMVNNIVIGAIQNDYDASGQNSLSNSGAAYVFNRDYGGTNNWGQLKKIVASDRHEDMLFGYSVSIIGSTLLIGAPRNDYDAAGGNFINQSGACYIYKEDQGGTDNWGELKKIIPQDRHEGDYFGWSASLGYSDIIAGARNNDYDIFGSDYVSSAGAAYLFAPTKMYGDDWETVNKVVSGNRTEGTVFGNSVGIDLTGNYAIVGNPGNVGSKGGVVSIFKSVIQAAHIEFRNVTANSISIICAAGEGASRTIFVREGNTGIAIPQHKDTYSANSTFGFGEQVGSSGWYCVYNGTGYKATVNGLNPNNTYRVMVCGYNGTSGNEIYFTCAAAGNPADITTGIDLSGTNIHIANGIITGTTTEMQYSLNSTNGTDGSWFNCLDTSTPVSFIQGKVYVRQKELISNFRLVATIGTAPAAPTFSINYSAERTNEIVTSSIEYNNDNDFSKSNSAGPDNYLILVPGTDYYFRVKATQSTLPGAVQHLVASSRNSAPIYTIDYINETTAENGDPSHEYSVNSNMSGAVTSTGIKIVLTPGTDLYIRSKATASSFSGEIQHLAVAARPVINYIVDFSTETTSQNVSVQDEYSINQDMSQANSGTGLRISLNPGENIYLRRKATISSFASDILTLVLPNRPEVPVVSLSDRNSTSAVFRKSADGTGEQVNVQDAMEYSENFGITWNPITPLVAVDASGMKYIIVRKMATSISFSSQSTENLDYEKPSVIVIDTESCNGPTDSVAVQSNIDNGKVYLILEGEPQSEVSDLEAAILSGKASSGVVSKASSDVIIPVEDLVPGKYNAYATNDWDSISDINATTIDVFGIPVVDLGEDIVKCKNTEITLDAGPGYSAYYWPHNGSSTQTIKVTNEDNYIVRVSNVNCNNYDTVSVIYNIPYQEVGICIVTIDLVTGKNIIVWEQPDTDQGISAYKLYREKTISIYDSIVRINASNLSIYRDINADPENQAYRYKITVVDTCGVESELTNSKYHEPVFLQYVSSEGGINLEWTDYAIEGTTNIDQYLTSYVIYRGTDSTGLIEYRTMGSTKKFTDTDPDALARKYYYRVAAVLKNPCFPTVGKKADSGPYSQSMSNIEDNRFQVGINDNLITSKFISIIPNPFKEYTTLIFSNPEGYPYKLSIMDLSGKVCRIVDDITTSEYLLKKGDLKQGLYFVELKGSKVYRGKIIIE